MCVDADRTAGFAGSQNWTSLLSEVCFLREMGARSSRRIKGTVEEKEPSAENKIFLVRNEKEHCR